MRFVPYILFIGSCLFAGPSVIAADTGNLPDKIDNKDFDPATLIWHTEPAEIWENALPIGNGRLGAMVYGGVEEERIQLNEDTYWSGGPYNTVVEGGHKYLPEIQKLLFDGEPIKAHKLFGRHLMGYPVEQMKYQSMGALHLFYEKDREYVLTPRPGNRHTSDGQRTRHDFIRGRDEGVPQCRSFQLRHRLFQDGWRGRK